MKYTIIKISSLLFCLSKYPALLWQLHQLLQTHCSTTAVVYLTRSLQQVFKRDDLSRRTLSMVLADVHGGVTTEVCDFISNTEQRRSRDVPPAWNNLIFSDGLPGVGTVSDSLSVARPKKNSWTFQPEVPRYAITEHAVAHITIITATLSLSVYVPLRAQKIIHHMVMPDA